MDYKRAFARDPAGTLHRITGEPAVRVERPQKEGTRESWLTAKQWKVAARIGEGKRFTLRSLAAELEMPVATIRSILVRLDSLFIIKWDTARGRFGGSFAKVIKGWRRIWGQRPMVEPNLSRKNLSSRKRGVQPESIGATIRPVENGMAAWRALKQGWKT